MRLRAGALLPCRLGPAFYQWLGANSAFLNPVAAAQGLGGSLPPASAALVSSRPPAAWLRSQAAVAASAEPAEDPAAEPAAAEPGAAPAAGAAGDAMPPPSCPLRVPRHCWQCGTPLPEQQHFFCPSCDSIQPADPDPQYFPVFGLEPSFDVDVGGLERRYRDLQRRLHPDKFSTASELEREYSQQQAAVVNLAYEVLKRPLRRAHYILQERGLGACEGMTITDPELLTYVMEAREEVEAAARDPPALARLLDENRALEGRCVGQLARAFREGDLERVAELTTQLRYLTRIQEAIVERL
eukprot:scaffold2.g7239.t1